MIRLLILIVALRVHARGVEHDARRVDLATLDCVAVLQPAGRTTEGQ